MMTALTSMPLVGLFCKSGILLGAALCLNRIFRNRSADLRRLVLSATVVAVMLSAAVAPALPRWTTAMPRWVQFQQPPHAPSFLDSDREIALDNSALAAPNLPRSTPQPHSHPSNLVPSLLTLVWLVGASALLLRFGFSLHRLRQLRSMAEPMIDPLVLADAARRGNPARLLQSEMIAAPLTWGIFRPVILVPTGFETLSQEYREAILCHELAHIHAADFLMRSLAEVARAAFWFQPLIWIARRQLHEEQEMACDNRVLASGGKASAYAKLLMDWDARPGMDFLVAVGMANRSCLRRRLYALLDPAMRHNVVAPTGVAGAWVLALAVALPLAAVNVTRDASLRPPVRSAQVNLPTSPRSAPVQIAQAATQSPSPERANAPRLFGTFSSGGESTVSGDWIGTLALPQNTLRFVMHVHGPAEALRATTDSPDQGTAGIKVDSIALSGSTLTFAIQYLDVKFSGNVNSNGTIVGTFTQHGTGVPLILTRTDSPPPPPQILSRPALPVTGGVFHHDRSGIEFTFPDGWSVREMATASSDPGEMAILGLPDQGAVFGSVWMRKIDTHPADIPGLLDAALTRKLASRAGKTGAIDEAVIDGYKIRPGGVEHLVINGQQALRAIGDFQEAGREFTEQLLWIYSAQSRAYFDLRGTASEFEKVQPVFEQLIESTRLP